PNTHSACGRRNIHTAFSGRCQWQPDQRHSLRIVDNSGKYGYFYGVYLQDEYKPFEQLTINFGGRFDIVDAFAHENQLSPRINIVYEPFKGTALRAGYARYFTPPPLENVEQGTVSKFNSTTNEPAIQKDFVTKSERVHYFDGGMTQQISKGFSVGIDGFLQELTFSAGRGSVRRGAYSFVVQLQARRDLRRRIHGKLQRGWLRRVSECGVRMGAWHEHQLHTILI